jgi:hypothetical protein
MSEAVSMLRLPLSTDFAMPIPRHWGARAPKPVTSARQGAGNEGFVVIQTHLSNGLQ